MSLLRNGLIIIAVTTSALELKAAPKLELRYETPATIWEDALPVGNGRMGAMIFGNPDMERIQLNEDSMWAGPENPIVNYKGTPEDLERIRNLVFEGKHHEADREIVKSFSRLDIVRSHQTLGDLWIDWEDQESPVSHYKRCLDLRTGVSLTTWQRGETTISQEVFCSFPDQVLVIHIKADRPGALAFEVGLDRPQDGDKVTHHTTATGHTLTMRGKVTQLEGKLDSLECPDMDGVDFITRCTILGEGQISAKEDVLEVRDASNITLLLTVSTSHNTHDALMENRLASRLSLESLRKRHSEDHLALMDRCVLDLGGHEANALPTDKRLEAIRNGANDPAMDALMFQYGRYLLVGSSRPGTNPANLQGLWNSHIKAPWNADYHLNINLQMNYWHANATNLSDCQEPLFDFMKVLAERRAETAKTQYAMRGWMAHHATDLWARPFMVARRAYWGSWIHGGGWLCQHLWTHYAYTQDKAFLRTTAWPLLSGQARFYLDWLVEKDGRLISVPETSPENSFLSPEDNESAAVCAAAAMGQQIIAEVLNNTLRTAEELGIENGLVEEIRAAWPKLEKGTNIGPDGRLLEWDKAYTEADVGHRHMSHLYAFHPGHSITEGKTPVLFEAVKQSISTRAENGSVGVGWSRAWAISIYARLKEGNQAHHHLNQMLKTQTLGNLFNSIFGIERPLFQIEANFGATSGIAEMLLQSHEDVIHILPALPDAWANEGSVQGLKARGGYEVNFSWEKGAVTNYKISHPDNRMAKVYVNGKIVSN